MTVACAEQIDEATYGTWSMEREAIVRCLAVPFGVQEKYATIHGRSHVFDGVANVNNFVWLPTVLVEDELRCLFRRLVWIAVAVRHVPREVTPMLGNHLLGVFLG